MADKNGAVGFLASLLGIETCLCSSVVHLLFVVFSVPIRDWNAGQYTSIFRWFAGFLASLLGIETDMKPFEIVETDLFLASLLGIETPYFLQNAFYDLGF